MKALQTIIARALVRLAIATAPAAQRDPLKAALVMLGRGGPGAPG